MGNQQVNGAAGPPPGAGQRQPRGGGGPHHHGAHHEAGPPGPQFGGGGGDPYGGGGGGGGGNKGGAGGYHHAMPPQQYNYQGAAGSGGGVMQQQQRTPSDVDMDMSGEGSSSSGPTVVGSGSGASPSGQFRSGMDLASLSAADDDAVPTVFRWEHGGRQVYITGTFNGWSRQIPMHRSGNDFTYIHNLKRGKHAFKFIVDDEWRFAPDQPTVADIEGRINNFIDVTEFKAYTGDRDFEKERSAAEYGGYGGEGKEGAEAPGAEQKEGSETKDPDGEVFSHTMPDLDEYTKEPPPLPPHLRHIILNKPPQLQDTAALPVPQHVALNHLYCTAIKDSMMVLGITQRYKTKFVTTVYYSPCKS